MKTTDTVITSIQEQIMQLQKDLNTVKKRQIETYKEPTYLYLYQYWNREILFEISTSSKAIDDITSLLDFKYCIKLDRTVSTNVFDMFHNYYRNNVDKSNNTITFKRNCYFHFNTILNTLEILIKAVK